MAIEPRRLAVQEPCPEQAGHVGAGGAGGVGGGEEEQGEEGVLGAGEAGVWGGEEISLVRFSGELKIVINDENI